MNAEIAQLVEHNLAKVRVASSSLVFRSHFLHYFCRTLSAEIAQLVEHNLAKVRVASSSLVFRSFLSILLQKQPAEIAQLVEHNLAKVRVASSSLVFRSFREVVHTVSLFLCPYVSFSLTGCGLECFLDNLNLRLGFKPFLICILSLFCSIQNETTYVFAFTAFTLLDY